MIDHINETRNEHILTIEDPVEFVHKSKKVLFTRENSDRTPVLLQTLLNQLFVKTLISSS